MADPTTSSIVAMALSETSIIPLANPTAPGVGSVGAADVNLNLDIQFSFANMDFTVNGANFVPPTVPVLQQIISGATTPQALMPPGSVFVLPPNSVIEISIPGGAVGSPVRSALQTSASLVLTDPNYHSIPSTFTE